MRTKSLTSDRDEMTVDEFSRAAGISVRTTRYYGTLGLLPAPRRRGRVAYYGGEHLRRLALVKTLQNHGYSLAEVGTWLHRLPPGASPDDIAARSTLLTVWAPRRRETVDRSALDGLSGRSLSDDELADLVRMHVLLREKAGYLPLAGFEVGVELLDVDISTESVVQAADLVEAHMVELANRLAQLLRHEVLSGSDPAAVDRRQQQVEQLRTLTLRAVVAGFQRASDKLITQAMRP